MDIKLTEYKKLLAKRVYLLSYIETFYMQCIVLDGTIVLNSNEICQECMFSF